MGLDKIILFVSLLVVAVVLVAIELHSRRKGQENKKENSVVNK
jgi:hypothetical protein